MDNLQINQAAAKPKTSQIIASQIVDELLKKSLDTKKEQGRARSGSMPHYSKSKQSDIQSISTMPGTMHTHNSDKQIPEKQNNRVEVKVPKNQSQINEGSWYLDKHGFMVSSSLDITKIKYYFIKVAIQHGMVVMRDLEDVLTIKTQTLNSFKCIFLMCLPLMSDRSVYQLQRYKNNKGSKIKITLISGNDIHFDQFRKNFYYQLWKKKVLNLPNYEALNLLCFANRSSIADSIFNYEQACSQFQIKNLGTEQEIQNWQMQLMKVFKKSQNNIKDAIFSGKTQNKIHQNRNSQIMTQRIILNQIPVCQFYLKMEMESNKQLWNKKKKIIQKYSLKMVFDYLQIEPNLLNEKYLSSNLPIQCIEHEMLPFSQAVYFLDQLNIVISPKQNIQKITNFGEKLIECYEIQSGKPNCVMDMDSQLPLTIYCALTSKNSQLKPIISFLKDYFEPQDSYQNQNRTLAALKAALEYIRQEWRMEEMKCKESL